MRMCRDPRRTSSPDGVSMCQRINLGANRSQCIKRHFNVWWSGGLVVWCVFFWLGDCMAKSMWIRAKVKKKDDGKIV